MLLPYLSLIIKKSLFVTSTLLIILFLLLFISTKQVFAAAAPFFYDAAPPANSTEIIPPTPCELPATCDNTAVPGEPNQCGQTCPTDLKGNKGDPWTKYSLSCWENQKTQVLIGIYKLDSPVCSIGDKCIAGETNLRYGSCDCGSWGPPPNISPYKYCCTTQGNPEACNTNAVQDNFPPPEGQCPGGYIVDGTRVRSSNCVPLVTCSVDTANPPNPYNQCGQTGGCTNDSPANHTVEITRDRCTPGDTYTYSCTDKGRITGSCDNPAAPTLDSFSGSATCWKADPKYTAALSWTGDALPSTDPGCASGFWVDISTNSGFSTFSNKCVKAKTLTTDGSGFGGPGGAFSFQANTTYYARVFNNSPDNNGHSNTKDLTVPAACVSDTQPPTCTLTLDTKTVTPGQDINIFTSASDNIKVSTLQLFNGTSSISPVFTNSINSNPYGVNYGWATPLQEGTYTISARATDSSNNTGSCQDTLKVIIPPCPIQPTLSGLSGTINSCTTSYTLQWSPPTLTDSWYNVRVDDGDSSAVNATSGTANTCSAHDICIDNYRGNSLAITIKPGKTYTWWVDTGSSNTSCTTQTSTAAFSPVCSSTSPVSGAAFCSGTNSQIFWQWNQGGNVCGTGSYTKVRFSDLTTSQFTDYSTSSNQTSFPSAVLTYSHNFTLGVFDNSGGSTPTCLSAPVTSLNCSAGCTLTANPSSGNVPLNTDLSVLVDTAGMPPSKRSQWDCDGDGNFEVENTAVSHNCSYGGTGSYNPTFRVVNSPGSSTVLAQCTTGITATSPGGGGNQPYCPDPKNNAPTVTLNPDGHTVTLRYSFDRDGNNTPSLTFFRNTQYGFIGESNLNSSLVNNQVGNFGTAFDTRPESSEYNNYQLEATNGQSSIKSNTITFRVPPENDNSSNACNQPQNNSTPSIKSAQLNSSTATSLTFNLTFTVDGSNLAQGCIMPCHNLPNFEPPYLKLSRQSGGTAYVAWIQASSIPNNNRTCISQLHLWGKTYCHTTRYIATYTIALPPNTTDTFTLSGYSGTQCSYKTAQGSAQIQCGTTTSNDNCSDEGVCPVIPNYTCSTTAGDPPSLMSAPTLTGQYQESPEYTQLVQLNWNQTGSGHQIKSYTNIATSGRWPLNNSIPGLRSFSGNTWTFTNTQDLISLPIGTYYYGAQVGQAGWCKPLQTDQASFNWTGFSDPWIQTTGGDIYSNTINTPGGP